MDRKKLIEDAAKAICAFEAGPEYWRTFIEHAEAALAVFEGAYTPTDDEREALDRAANALHGDDCADDDCDGGDMAHYERQAHVALSAMKNGDEGLNMRGEPSREDLTEAISDAFYGNHHDPSGRAADAVLALIHRTVQGEPSDAQLLAQGFTNGVSFIDDHPGPWGAGMVAGRAEAARLRAAAETGGGR